MKKYVGEIAQEINDENDQADEILCEFTDGVVFGEDVKALDALHPEDQDSSSLLYLQMLMMA